MLHHCAPVIYNCTVTACQICSNERLQYYNNISYMQAYCHELIQSRYESRINVGDNLYNWQFYIQEPKAKERRRGVLFEELLL
jgi:hypothetical protein